MKNPESSGRLSLRFTEASPSPVCPSFVVKRIKIQFVRAVARTLITSISVIRSHSSACPNGSTVAVSADKAGIMVNAGSA